MPIGKSFLCKSIYRSISVLKFYLLAGLIFLSLSCATVRTKLSQPAPELDVAPTTPHPPGFSQADGTQKLAAPTGKTLVMSFGPKLLELKASYLEKREQAGDLNSTLQDGKLRQYLDLLATSSFGVNGLTGEGDLSYSLLDSLQSQCACKEWPKLLRLGLKNRWGSLSYGADYKSVDRGFVSIAGAATDQPRDEGQLWAEHSFGLFNIRGSIGESWEKLADTNGLRATKRATASLNFNRSQWGANLTSSYEWIEQGTVPNQETTVFTHALAGSYRPLSFLSLSPNFSIREELNQNTGVRTETPRTELIFAYTPFPDALKLTGVTSFAQSFGSDTSNNVRTFGTTAAVDWKIGKFIGQDDILSFNLNYNQQLDSISLSNSHLFGLLRLRIAGF
jgi:hypothetical protein